MKTWGSWLRSGHFGRVLGSAPAMMEVSQFHLRFRLIWCDASVCILYFFGSIEIFISGPLELLKYFFSFSVAFAINNA